MVAVISPVFGLIRRAPFPSCSSLYVTVSPSSGSVALTVTLPGTFDVSVTLAGISIIGRVFSVCHKYAGKILR